MTNHGLLEITADKSAEDDIRAIAEKAEVPITEVTAPAKDRLGVWRILAGTDKRQDVLDKLQRALGKQADWRIIILPVEAVLPRPKKEPEPTEAQSEKETREELYEDIARSAKGGTDFYLLAALSAVVAAIGLLTDNIAVVIGAMVIAPLLGPNIAFAYSTILGDKDSDALGDQDQSLRRRHRHLGQRGHWRGLAARRRLRPRANHAHDRRL